MENTKSFNRLMAHYLKEYTSMQVEDFEAVDTMKLTMAQAMAYNYVLESKSSTKVADKVMALIKEDEESFFEPFRPSFGSEDLKMK